MYFFIILCLHSQVCIEFFLCVFGLVLVLQYLHSHARRPPARHPPHHHLLGYRRRFSTVRPSCGNNSVCATDLAPRLPAPPSRAPCGFCAARVVESTGMSAIGRKVSVNMSTDSCTPPDCASVSRPTTVSFRFFNTLDLPNTSSSSMASPSSKRLC